ncbi:hypothetical protein NMY22_g17002 [Coprinellus aureogranulatus]|nr:hypothetical protein NMY22_g17002 [Coprinellus aureogranulatus]
MPFNKGVAHPEQSSGSEYAEWLKGHHRIVESGEPKAAYNVFIVETQPVFVKDRKYSVTVAVPSGPAVLTFDLSFRSVKDLAVTVYVTVPLLPPTKLGHIEGNVDKGITLNVSQPNLCEGRFIFYNEEGNVFVERSVTILGKEYGGDIELLTNPSLEMIRGSLERHDSGDGAFLYFVAIQTNNRLGDLCCLFVVPPTDRGLVLAPLYTRLVFLAWLLWSLYNCSYELFLRCPPFCEAAPNNKYLRPPPPRGSGMSAWGTHWRSALDVSMIGVLSDASMRVASVLLPLLSVLASAAWAVDPSPSQQGRELRQMTGRELAARAKYPEHFYVGRNSRGARREEGGDGEGNGNEGEGEGEPAPPVASPPPSPEPCLSGQIQNSRRNLVEHQVLTPKEVHAFLKGRGRFVSDNGTVYVDEHFIKTYEQGKKFARSFPKMHSLYRRVKDSMGSTLVAISVPVYKKWKDNLTPGRIFWLSAQSYIRHEDVPEIERLFLEDPDFTEVEVHDLPGISRATHIDGTHTLSSCGGSLRAYTSVLAYEAHDYWTGAIADLITKLTTRRLPDLYLGLLDNSVIEQRAVGAGSLLWGKEALRCVQLQECFATVFKIPSLLLDRVGTFEGPALSLEVEPPDTARALVLPPAPLYSAGFSDGFPAPNTVRIRVGRDAVPRAAILRGLCASSSILSWPSPLLSSSPSSLLVRFRFLLDHPAVVLFIEDEDVELDVRAGPAFSMGVRLRLRGRLR